MIIGFVATLLIATFTMLALLHIYWAAGGRALKLAAVPEVSGQRAFSPSAAATLAVAAALLAAALVVAAASGLLRVPVPAVLIDLAVFGLALVLFARAVGDFHLVGFFKRVRGTNFARADTRIYSPLCLLLSLGVFAVGWANLGIAL